MTILDHAWLGYAPTPDSAVAIIKETGLFYLLISGAYCFSYFSLLLQSSGKKREKNRHGFFIFTWALMGGRLIYEPRLLSLFFNGVLILFSLTVLYQLHFTGPLLAQAAEGADDIKTDDKKALYGKYLLKKAGYTLKGALECTLINEHILWALILYRAAITARASWGL